VVGAEGVRAHPDGIVPVGGAMLTLLTPPQAPIRSLSYQHGTSER
jgi:hypothetical protein